MHWRGGLLIAFTLLLVACGGNTYAPVSERSAPGQSQPSPREYIVRRGDTLYAIAFKYGLDYRQLASRNGIGSDYSIYPGQRLQLKAGAAAKSSGSIIRDASIVAPKPIITSSRNASRKSSTQAAKPKPVNKPAPAAKTSTAAKVVAKKAEPSPSPARTSEQSKPVGSTGPIKWRWPASGKLIGTFKTRGTVNKGINIAGQRGDAIKAAAQGRVVYAGNGLLGYGNLVIVDHNQQFLSAYAHNSRVLVKENDMVEAGQKIAEMGSSGADRIMLHFEIRRDGQPVNPLKFLPRR